MFKWLFGGVGSAAEKIGDAVNKNIRTLKGDRAEEAEHIHDEQMATLAEHAAEFASRPERTWFDSLVDGLNRLPRPLFMLWVLAVFLWPFFDVAGFLDYMRAMEIVPETIWTLVITLASFYFGGRIVASDLKKPKLSPEQKKLALDIIREREQAIIEARTPLIIEVAPTRKPPPPVRPAEQLPEVPVTRQGSAAIDAMIADLIRREAGYVNDPADDGGPTKYGITWRTLSDWRDADCGEAEVKALTKGEATDIYRASYYFGPRFDALPEGLQAHVFDIGVNSGPRAGVRMLQQALNVCGCAITEDGVIGPETLDAACARPANEINHAMAEIRQKFYLAIVARNPEKKRFLTGWLDRAKLFDGSAIA